MNVKARELLEQEPSVELGSFSAIDAVPTGRAQARLSGCAHEIARLRQGQAVQRDPLAIL
jgi:hypothetical protein